MASLTYDELVAQIASRLNRDDLDPTPQGTFIIRNTCVDRVDFYKKECFYSGLVVDSSITLNTTDVYYNFPDGWEEAHTMQILQGSVWIDLTRTTHEKIDSMDVNQPSVQGVPSLWAPFGTQFRIFPRPVSAYSVQIVMNIPPNLPAPNASNFWTGDAKSLVINGVAAEVADGYLHNHILADRYRPLEERELLAMQAKTLRIRGIIQVEPYI